MPHLEAYPRVMESWQRGLAEGVPSSLSPSLSLIISAATSQSSAGRAIASQGPFASAIE